MARTLVCLAIAAFLGACGGGGNPPTAQPSSNLSGWWRVELREVDSASPFQDTFRIQMRQTGSTVTFHGHDGLESGSRVTWAIPTAVAPNRQLWDLDAVSSDRLVGIIDVLHDDAPAYRLDARLTRTQAPVGALTARGLINLAAVNVESSTAYARDLSSGTSHVYEVRDSRPDGEVVVRIGFAPSDPSWEPVAGVIYDLGVTPGLTAVLEYEGAEGALAAESGSVLFTWLDETHVAGSYTASFGVHGSLTGLFDTAAPLGD